MIVGKTLVNKLRNACLIFCNSIGDLGGSYIVYLSYSLLKLLSLKITIKGLNLLTEE